MANDPVILGIETSCDETAAAVVAGPHRVLSNVVATQFDVHARYGGVVPELASRAHIENLDGVIQEAMAKAGVAGGDLDAIAVTHRPGLVGCLLIGVTAAKALALAWNKPLIGVNHIHAHACSAAIEWGAGAPAATGHGQDGHATKHGQDARATLDGQDARATRPAQDGRSSGDTRSIWPAVALVVSGGHTSLFRVREPLDIELLGSTIDDAAGEAFDKVASILKLGFPGGPVVDRIAKAGDAARYSFPRTMLDRDSLDFSFSGVKTAVLYQVHGPGKTSGGLERLSGQDIADITASFQAAVVDVLVAKTMLAVQRTGVASVVVGGGVAANSRLREQLTVACRERGVALHLTPMKYCTDNGAMIAALACCQLRAGRLSDLMLEPLASG